MNRRLRFTRLESRLAPAIVTWDGGGNANNWTTDANWVGDVAPVPDVDDLVFPSGAGQLANVNDFVAGTEFRSLAVNGAGYALSGNAVTLTSGISADIAAGGTSTIALALGGTGGLVKNGLGTLVLSSANSYSGLTSINAGAIDIRNGASLGAIGVNNETVIFTPSGKLVMNGSFTLAEPILATGTELGFPNFTLHVVTGAVTYSGALTVAQYTTIVVEANTTFTLTGSIGQTGGAGPRTLNLGGFGTGTIIFAPGSVITHTAGISVNALVLFNGQMSDPITFIGPAFFQPPPNAGVVSGNGVIGPVSSTSGIVNPGNVGAIGTLTTGDLSLLNTSRTFSRVDIDLNAAGARASASNSARIMISPVDRDN